MKNSSPIGLVAGFALIFGAIFLGEGWQTFFDLPSFILVVGGTVAALLVAFSFAECKAGLAALKDFFTYKAPDLAGYVRLFSDLARTARRDGLLALDRRLGELDDAFVRFGMEMAVDGVEEEAIGAMIDQKVGDEMARRQLGVRFMNFAGQCAPAFGMVGTLIGLIQMLQNLTDPSQIGSGMAVALITTFYGAMLSNLVFLPIAARMKAQLGELVKGREMARAGIMAIVQGDSPSLIEKRLLLFLGEDAPPAEAPPLAQAA